MVNGQKLHPRLEKVVENSRVLKSTVLGVRVLTQKIYYMILGLYANVDTLWVFYLNAKSLDTLEQFFSELSSYCSNSKTELACISCFAFGFSWFSFLLVGFQNSLVSVSFQSTWELYDFFGHSPTAITLLTAILRFVTTTQSLFYLLNLLKHRSYTIHLSIDSNSGVANPLIYSFVYSFTVKIKEFKKE